MTMKRLMEYYTTKGYFLSQKLSKQSLSVGTMTIFWQDILVSIKPKTSLARNTIGQASKKILRSINVKGCDICLGSKAFKYKPYKNLQSLPIPTYLWKDFLMNFVIGLPIWNNWKRESYDSILVIVDWLTKMVDYEPVKITINSLSWSHPKHVSLTL